MNQNIFLYQIVLVCKKINNLGKFPFFLFLVFFDSHLAAAIQKIQKTNDNRYQSLFFKDYDKNKDFAQEIRTIRTNLSNAEKIDGQIDINKINVNSKKEIPASGGYKSCNFTDDITLYTTNAFECVILGIVDFQKQKNYLFHINISQGWIDDKIQNKIKTIAEKLNPEYSKIAMLSANYSSTWTTLFSLLGTNKVTHVNNPLFFNTSPANRLNKFLFAFDLISSNFLDQSLKFPLLINGQTYQPASLAILPNGTFKTLLEEKSHFQKDISLNCNINLDQDKSELISIPTQINSDSNERYFSLLYALHLFNTKSILYKEKFDKISIHFKEDNAIFLNYYEKNVKTILFKISIMDSNGNSLIINKKQVTDNFFICLSQLNNSQDFKIKITTENQEMESLLADDQFSMHIQKKFFEEQCTEQEAPQQNVLIQNNTNNQIISLAQKIGKNHFIKFIMLSIIGFLILNYKKILNFSKNLISQRSLKN